MKTMRRETFEMSFLFKINVFASYPGTKWLPLTYAVCITAFEVKLNSYSFCCTNNTQQLFRFTPKLKAFAQTRSENRISEQTHGSASWCN